MNKRNSQEFLSNLFTFGIVNKCSGVKIVFYHNYVNQCNNKGMSPSAAAEAMGFKRSMVTRWKDGSQPRQATLQRMADFFECSVTDLTEETKKDQPGEGLVNDDPELTEYLKELQSRPEMKMLFHTFKTATKEQIEAIVTAWEARNNVKGE